MSTSHRRPASKHRVTASTLLATAAATVGIGLATSAPASADTGNVLKWPKTPSISHETPTFKPDPQKVAVVKAVIKRVLSKACAEPETKPAE